MASEICVIFERGRKIPMNLTASPQESALKKSNKRKRLFKQNWDLYVLVAPVIVYFIIFKYVPMYGVQIAFKDFISVEGITGSPWVGMKHFSRFFDSFYFGRLLGNTLIIGFWELLVGFPIPIIFALFINEVRSKKYKSLIQNISLAPHFLSTVVVVGMMYLLLHPQTGIINHFVAFFGGERINFMTESAWFKPIYIISGIWQHLGWNAIIYIAALSNIDPQIHEAAEIDGASRFQRMLHINLPSLKPTIVVMLILQCGSILGVGFEKVFLMQNSLNMAASDVISTHVYRTGIIGSQYSYSTAIGLFESVVNFTLIILANYAAKKINKVSLW